MKIRCDRCNNIIEEIIMEYNADIKSTYELDEETGFFKLSDKEVVGERDTNISCSNCGKSLSEEIVFKLNIE